MIAKGVGSLLFKWDLKCYYHQYFVDPADVSKLVYYLDNLMFFDSTLPMGITSFCCITQCVSSIMSQCLSGSGCSKDQENYNLTTAGLNSELFINNHFNCTQFVQEINAKGDTNKVYKLPLF